MVNLCLPLLSQHYKATLKGSPLYKGQSLKGRHAPEQLSWHACHGQPPLSFHLTTLQGNFERADPYQRTDKYLDGCLGMLTGSIPGNPERQLLI